MATYAYKASWDYEDRNTVYINFNLSPANGGTVYPGATITVTGQVYCAEGKLTRVGMSLAVNPPNGLDPGLDETDVVWVSKSVPKSTLTSFTLSFKITPALWTAIHNKWLNIYNSCWLVPSLWVYGAVYDGEFSLGTYIGTTPHYVMKLVSPASPSVSSPEIVDLHPAQAMTAVGRYVENYNTLQYHATVNRDVTTYPINNVHHTLTVTDYATGEAVATLTATTNSDTLVIDMPVFKAGSYTYSLSCVDDFGGAFHGGSSILNIVPYSPPSIVACSFERYQEVETDTGYAHEASPSGELIWLNLDANIAAVNSRNAWTATLTAWRKGRTEITPSAGQAVYENTTGERRTVSAWALAGSDGQRVQLARDEANLGSEMVLSAAFDWSLRLTITDALGNSVTLLVDDDIRKDSAVLDVGPYGVSIGARSTALESDPRFECAWPAHFYGNVAVPAGGLLKVHYMRTASRAVAANGWTTYNDAISPGDGWTPLAVVGYYVSSGQNYPYTVKTSGSNLDVRLHNTTTSAFSSVYIDVYVLCVRTSL